MERKTRRTSLENKLYVRLTALVKGHPKEQLFKKILTDWEEFVLDELVKGNRVPFPKIGSVKIKRFKVKPGGTKVDYDKTAKLWAMDKEAMENKKVVRFNNIGTDDYCPIVTFSGIGVSKLIKPFPLKDLKMCLKEAMLEDYTRFEIVPNNKIFNRK